MKRTNPITTLFLDIGGVLLTNGWDHQARKRAATHFKLEWDEEEVLHHLMFDTYEEGKLTLDEYLSRAVFNEERPFTRDQYREFMFAQSRRDGLGPGAQDLHRLRAGQRRLRAAIPQVSGRCRLAPRSGGSGK